MIKCSSKIFLVPENGRHRHTLSNTHTQTHTHKISSLVNEAETFATPEMAYTGDRFFVDLGADLKSTLTHTPND